MTQRDGAPVDVDLGHVQLVLVGVGQDDDGQGLVDLPEVDVVVLEAELGEQLVAGGFRGDRVVDRGDRRVGVA